MNSIKITAGRTRNTVKEKNFWERCWNHKALILMSLPGLAAVFIFSYIPMYGILIAFQDYNPIKGMFGANSWVGLKYFKQFFSKFYLDGRHCRIGYKLLQD